MVINEEQIDLSDPETIRQEIDVYGLETKAHEFLKLMLSIRAAEHKIAFGKKEGLIGGPVHLGVGQEAVAVGVAAGLRSTDRVFGAHRSHAHILAMKIDFKACFAEVLGRKTGYSKGMGGSMHLWNQPSGFYGSVPIVSGTVPLAVGAGLAAKLQGSDDIAVAYFGDGAIEEGVVHECFNLAKVHQIPVLFVVENNLFASHMHISQRQPNTSTTRFAVANEIPALMIDGNDVAAVSRAAKQLITSARQGKGPGFLELVTYRWYGHVDWREDIDVGVNRSAEDLQKWKRLDPVERLKVAMIDNDMLSESAFRALEQDIFQEAEIAWDKALEDPYPEDEVLLSHVYHEETKK